MKVAPGYNLQVPKGTKNWRIYMMRFVDDKRHYINLLKEIIKENLIKAMELSVSTWYEIILFIGDKLELSKCLWFLID